MSLRERRIGAGAAQAAIARAAHVHPSYLSRLERFERRPSQAVLDRLEAVLVEAETAARADAAALRIGYSVLELARDMTTPTGRDSGGRGELHRCEPQRTTLPPGSQHVLRG